MYVSAELPNAYSLDQYGNLPVFSASICMSSLSGRGCHCGLYKQHVVSHALWAAEAGDVLQSRAVVDCPSALCKQATMQGLEQIFA